MKQVKRTKVYEKRIFQLKLRKLIIIIFLSFEYISTLNLKNLNGLYKNISLKEKRHIHQYNYESEKFAILTAKCTICSLFSFYIYYLGCVNKYILEGYVTVIDMKSYPNIYNNFTINEKKNPWEYLFEQPFGYTLDEVLKNAKNKEYFDCIQDKYRPSETTIFYNKVLIDFWHDVSKKYLPIKKEIIKESKDIMKHLFKNSLLILGVKIRGTDYVATRPSCCSSY